MTLRLSAGVDDGKGGFLERAERRDFSDATFVARLQNRGKEPLSVVIHATPLSHGNYTIEVRDGGGRPVNLRAFGRCGTMSPLMEHEIVDVAPGETFQILVGGHFDSQTRPGAYEARIRYEAYENDRFGEDRLDPVVVERLKHFWTGTLHSNWVPVTILPAGPAP
jgi:hypothetical protein